MKATIGQIVSARRREIRMSIRELSRRVGCSRNWVQRLEQDKTSNPRLKFLLKLCIALDWLPTQLLGPLL
jgi:transcriptional regulator with XRE-family HTH domain